MKKKKTNFSFASYTLISDPSQKQVVFDQPRLEQSFGSTESILKNAVILDIETLGLKTESIHEIAMYDLNNRNLNIFIPEVNLIRKIEAEANAATKASSASTMHIDVLAGLREREPAKFEPLLKQMTYRDIAFADYLMNKRKYSEIIQNIERLKAQDTFNNNSLLETKLNALEDRLRRLSAVDADNTILAPEKELQKAGIMLEDLSIYRDQELLKGVGFHEAFSRDEEFLAKYILEGSEGFEKFAKQNASEAEYLRYLYDKNVKYDPDFFNRLKQSYANKLKLSGQYVQSIFESTKINVMHASMSDIMQQIAQERDSKALFVANLSFESKKFGAQTAALAYPLLQIEEQKYRAEKNITGDLTKSDVAEIRSRAYLQASPFAQLSQPISASTGEPFYATGIEYNKSLTEAKLFKDFSNIQLKMQTTATGTSNLDIQDVIRSQQSMLINAGLLDAKRPIGLSMEAQSRLYMFTNMLEQGASEEALTEVLADFKETHTAGLDTMLHENIALTESMQQTEALGEYLRGTDKGKQLALLAKQRKGPLYKSMVYAQLMQQLAPSIEAINLNKRFASDLKQISEFGYITQSRIIAKPLYRDQISIVGGTLLERVKLQSPGYDRDYIQSYHEYKQSILSNPLYSYKGREQDYARLEQELLANSFIYQTSRDAYEFVPELLDKSDQSEGAIATRNALVKFTADREKTAGDTIQSFKKVSSILNKEQLLQKADRIFHSDSMLPIKPEAEITKGAPEQRVAQQIREALNMAQEHKQTASLLSTSNQRQYSLNLLNEIDEYSRLTGYGTTPSGFTEEELTSASTKYRSGESIGSGAGIRSAASAPTQEKFVEAFFEAKYHADTGSNLTTQQILSKDKNNFAYLQKKSIEQAALRGSSFGKSQLAFEADINSINLYGSKTIEQYRLDFEDYQKTGKLITSYGTEYADPEYSRDLSTEEMAKRYAQVNVELEESYRQLPRAPKAQVPILTEPELKQHLYEAPIDLTQKPTVTPGVESLESFERVSKQVALLNANERNQIANKILTESFDNGLEKYYGSLLDSPAGAKFFGMYGAGVLGLAALSLQQAPEKPESVLSPDFDAWFQNQAQFFGGENEFRKRLNDKYYASSEGMSEQGIAPLLRKAITDFGSPYQGPAISLAVFEDQKLMQERREYTRAVFTEKYFTPKGDIYNMLRGFVGAKFKEPIRSFPIDVEQISSQEAMSLKGANLVKLNLNDGYDITVEDADTITIQKKGTPDNALAKFMGSGNYSFRLAGIDAPETAHDDRAAQPYAEQAKAVLQQMVSEGKDLNLVFDPANVTYGRQVATLMAGDKNLNLELLKRGAVAYLPYEGKGEEQMYNEKAFSAAQKYAMESRRGMFSQPFFQVYNDIYKQTNQSVTFNTFANYDKAARDSNLTNMLAVMLSAQKESRVTDVHKQEIEQIVNDIKFSQTKAKSKLDFLQTARLQLTYQNKSFGRPFQDDYTSIDMHLSPARHNEFLPELQNDLKRLIETKGSKQLTNKLQYNGSMLDNNIALIEATKNPVGHATMPASSNRNKAARIRQMEALQHNANRSLKVNPIQHNRM